MSKYSEELADMIDELRDARATLKELIIKQHFLIKLLNDQTCEVDRTSDYIGRIRAEIKILEEKNVDN